MKVLRVCTCLMLSAYWIAVLGCNKANTPVAAQRIQVTNCVATPDSLSVHDNEPVIWVTDVDYQVKFSPANTPAGPAVPVTTNPFTVKAGITVPQIMHGPSNCSTAGCFYKYSLTRFNNGVPASLPCVDPGIRILP